MFVRVCVCVSACLSRCAVVTFPRCSNSPDVRAALCVFSAPHPSIPPPPCCWLLTDALPRLLSSSEQPGPVQVLLTPNQEEKEDQQDAALGQVRPPPPYRPAPPRPPFSLSIPHPCAPSSQGETEEGGCAGAGVEGGEEGREGVTGVRLCELLQAGGVSVRPLGKHLAISLPSLPLRLWDTHTAHTAHSTHPPPPTSPPPPSSPLEKKPLTPLWQPPRPHSPTAAAAATTQHWPKKGAGAAATSVAAESTRHWSSWSLDRPDAVVTPYDTPPDRCIPIRPQAPSQHYSYSCQSSPGHHSSQHAPGQECDPGCEHEEAELSELDSLYQASLQAGRTGTHVDTHTNTLAQG